MYVSSANAEASSHCEQPESHITLILIMDSEYSNSTKSYTGISGKGQHGRCARPVPGVLSVADASINRNGH